MTCGCSVVYSSAFQPVGREAPSGGSRTVADTGQVSGGGCDIDLQWTQCFAGPYCVNQSLPHTYIYEERSRSLV